MARNFSSCGVHTASVLLKTIPADQQSILVQNLTANLRTSFDGPAASLLVGLVYSQDDSRARRDLLDLLVARVEDGEPSGAAALLRQDQRLGRDMLEVAADRLSRLAKIYQQDSSLIIPAFIGIPRVNDQDTVRTEQPEAASAETAIYWLHFAKAAYSSGLPSEADGRLADCAFLLLGAVDRSASLAARDLAFSLIHDTHSQKSSISIPKVIEALISADSKHHQTVGYALWLKSLVASDENRKGLIAATNAGYWGSIHTGLRHGDSERRKLSLEILKRSVALVIEQGHIGLVAKRSDASEVAVVSQYSRYCTVFETVALARYTNLVVECKKDLDLLASQKSVLKSEWLYTLLATALDNKTQDQNRRFIGNWILEADLDASKAMDGFVKLLESILSWVTEGHLFVSSVVQTDSSLHCLHGDNVANFVVRVLRQHAGNDEATARLIHAMFEFLICKRNTLFSHATVHLLRGISQAFAEVESLSLTLVQLEQLSTISGWRALPEVAYDVAVLYCSKIYDLSKRRTSNEHTGQLSQLAQDRLAALQTRAALLESADSRQEEQPTSLEHSQRDVAIAAAVGKCDNILAQRQDANSSAPVELQDQLEDIWSDLEYLEYPRELLVRVPATILNDGVVQAALQEDTGNHTGIRAFLTAILPRLQTLTKRRSFLTVQLMTALRNMLLSSPETAGLFDVEECLLDVARDPPEASIDLQLEYAAIPLLEEVLGKPQHEKYFGLGESHGFAAYLDLLGRLGVAHPQINESMLKTLLERWKAQRIPPPVVSGWKTTLQLQVMLLCLEQHAATASLPSLDSTLKDLYYILSVEPLPRYRFILEWMVVRVQLRHPNLRSQTLQLMSTKDHHSNPKFLASLMKIGVMLTSTDTAAEDFALELASSFIGPSASSKIVIRHEAQWSFPFLMDRARAFDWKPILNNRAYTALDDYIRSLPRFGDPPPERTLSKLDPVTDNNMTNLAEGLWTSLDHTPPPLARHADFLALYENDRSQTRKLPASCLPLGPPIPRTNIPELPSSAPTPLPTQSLYPLPQEESTALQTKGTAYLKTALSNPTQPSATKQHDLLVVASLIENPYNLGGLSRCSEIFGARALHVSDPRVTAHKDFTSVAVSSHNHLPILPLPAADIPAFLQAKRGEGYTVVGIEQTDRSVLLGGEGCMLPDKAILVLGSEREGMPAFVLGECDTLVEIPQVGVTRSMNVQTAAAVVLYEYERQRNRT